MVSDQQQFAVDSRTRTPADPLVDGGMPARGVRYREILDAPEGGVARDTSTEGLGPPYGALKVPRQLSAYLVPAAVFVVLAGATVAAHQLVLSRDNQARRDSAHTTTDSLVRRIEGQVVDLRVEMTAMHSSVALALAAAAGSNGTFATRAHMHVAQRSITHTLRAIYGRLPYVFGTVVAVRMSADEVPILQDWLEDLLGLSSGTLALTNSSSAGGARLPLPHRPEYWPMVSSCVVADKKLFLNLADARSDRGDSLSHFSRCARACHSTSTMTRCHEGG